MKNILMTMLIMVCVIAASLYMVMQRPASSTQEPSGSGKATIGGAFSLINQDGKRVTEKDFEGKLLLVYFGFTSCPDVCPRDVLTLSEVMDGLGDDAPKVQALFISIDPERDTPIAMKNFLASFHPSIMGLTGTAEEIAAVAKAWKVYYNKVESDSALGYVVDHSSYTYLMDENTEYLSHFAHNSSAKEMLASIRKRLHDK